MGTRAVIFDLDGVLTDTAEFHFLSWLTLARELGIPFDRTANEHLRGLSREESLARLLGARLDEFDASQRADLTRRKNDDYLRRVESMTARDLLPGARELIDQLRGRGIAIGLGSSSRNARLVLARLGIADRFDAIVDGNDAPRSKPDPQVFLLAAERLGRLPVECVVIEDAASGIEAAQAAGMRVIGVGPAERVGMADRCFPSMREISVEMVLG